MAGSTNKNSLRDTVTITNSFVSCNPEALSFTTAPDV